MSEDFLIVDSKTNISEIKSELEDNNHALILIDEKFYAGVLTEKILFRRIRDNSEEQLGTLALKVPTVDKETSLFECARLMVENKTDLLPVFEKDYLIGIIRSEDILTRLGNVLFKDEKTEYFMTRGILTLNSDTTIAQARFYLERNRISCAPVIEDSRMIGLVTRHDIVKETMIPKEEPRWKGHIRGEPVSPSNVLITSMMVGQDMIKTAKPQDSIIDVIGILVSNKISQVVVVDDKNNPIGMISKEDILDAIYKKMPEENLLYVRVASDIEDLDRQAILDEMLYFGEKYKSILGVGAMVAHFKEQKKKMRGIPNYSCRLRISTDNFKTQVRESGFGEEQAIKNALKILGEKVLSEAHLRQNKKHIF